ncbi:MAG: hypothetical protein PF517_07340 [Salinivirgaceae bacterium]|jgi:hypothetical protein|nr:hypothetical protein [Salinivirgaceae bacterium]
MIIIEKIQYAADKTIFTLFKEGLFYKCYNEDAMVFARMVKNYKVNSKFVKSVGAEVLSLGFPVSEVEKGNISFEVISEAIKAVSYKEETHGVVFSLNEDIKHDYLKYFEEIQKTKYIVEENQLEYNPTPKDVLAKMIQEFDLANSTPMQGMVFIQELKKHLKTQD